MPAEKTGKRLMVPRGTKYIEKAAYLNQKSLEVVALPENLEKIGELAFDGCGALKKVYLSRGLKAIGRYAFFECKSLEEIVIPEGVTKIEEWTFAGCDNLRKVVLPESLISIDSRAFDSCISLVDIRIPGNVESIGYHAFSGCGSLMDIRIPEGVRRLEEGMFENCEKLKRLQLPETLVSIEAGAFKNCKSLTDLKLPENLSRLGANVFFGCEKLESIQGGKRVEIFCSRQYFDDSSAFSYIRANMPDISKIMDRDWKEQALLLYIENRAAGKEIPEPVCESYLEYLKTWRKKFYALALKNEALLEYMCEEKIILKEEAEELMNRAISEHNIQVSARLLEYQNQEQKEEQGAFDRELEEFLAL